MALQCFRMGVAGPEGNPYCSTKMNNAVIPPAARRKVKCEMDDKHPKASAQGMGDIPGDVMRALINKMSREAEMIEREISV